MFHTITNNARKNRNSVLQQTLQFFSFKHTVKSAKINYSMSKSNTRVKSTLQLLRTNFQNSCFQAIAYPLILQLVKKIIFFNVQNLNKVLNFINSPTKQQTHQYIFFSLTQVLFMLAIVKKNTSKNHQRPTQESFNPQ